METLYIDCGYEFLKYKKDDFIILTNNTSLFSGEITKEKAREIIEFLTKFVEEK